MVHKLTHPTCNPPRSSRTHLPRVPSKGQPTNFSAAPTIKPTPTLCFLFLLIPTTITTTAATAMFQYPYAANGDPDLDLLAAVCCSTGQPIIGQPMNSPLPNHPPFLVNTPFPTSSSLPSSNDYFMNRSSSTHSLAHRAGGIPDPAAAAASASAAQVPFFSSSACDFHHSEPVRRVYSTGDLQGMNYTQASSAENCAQEGAAAGRVGRYSAEERKERIERYRSKRNHRNFHKKITYACRKTLADSRPRVRGRFARNGEAETEIEAESSEASYECYSHSTRDNGGNYNNFDGSASEGDWLKQMQAALASADGEEECCYDEEVWASLDTVFSMNLLS